MTRRIGIGYVVASRRLQLKLQSLIRVVPRTTRFAASVGPINFDNSQRPSMGSCARRVLSLLAGLALGACSSMASTSPIHSEEKIVSSPAPATAPRPDAPEVLRRLLALIDTLHQPQDLTIERVAQFSGFAMIPYSDKPNNDAYGIFRPLTEMWWYGYTWKLNSATHLPDLGFGFSEAEKYVDQDPPMTGICQLDLSQFHDALLKMEYRHVGNTRRESAGKQYQRGLVEIDVGIVGESNESLEKISHGCVNRVSIGFLEKYMDLGAM